MSLPFNIHRRNHPPTHPKTTPIINTQVAAALDVVEQALRLYGPERCFASYNGGKVCVTNLLALYAGCQNHLIHPSIDVRSSNRITPPHTQTKTPTPPNTRTPSW